MIFAGINPFLSSERQRTSARGIALARPDIPVRQYLTGAAPAGVDGGNVAQQAQPFDFCIQPPPRFRDVDGGCLFSSVTA